MRSRTPGSCLRLPDWPSCADRASSPNCVLETEPGLITPESACRRPGLRPWAVYRPPAPDRPGVRVTSSASGSDGNSSSARWPLKRAITQSSLDGISRAILQLIADEVNDSLTLPQKFSPSRSELASRSGFAASAVDDAIKRLASAGWLRNLNPPRTKSRWQLSVPQEIATPAGGVVAVEPDGLSTPPAGQALPRQTGMTTPAGGVSTSKTSQAIQVSSGAEAVKPDEAEQDHAEQRLVISGQDSPGLDIPAEIRIYP